MDTYIEFCIRFWEATRELDLYSMDGSQLDRLIVDALSKTNGGKELIKTSMNELSVLIRAINHNNRKIQPPSLPSNLEEAAEEYRKGVCGHPMYYTYTKQCFIAWAKWQAEQILKGAVEADGEVCKLAKKVWINLTDEKKFHQVVNENFKDGDKVRIIIVKED